jgi:hypothetical protein
MPASSDFDSAKIVHIGSIFFFCRANYRLLPVFKSTLTLLNITHLVNMSQITAMHAICQTNYVFRLIYNVMKIKYAGFQPGVLFIHSVVFPTPPVPLADWLSPAPCA